MCRRLVAGRFRLINVYIALAARVVRHRSRHCRRRRRQTGLFETACRYAGKRGR